MTSVSFLSGLYLHYLLIMIKSRLKFTSLCLTCKVLLSLWRVVFCPADGFRETSHRLSNGESEEDLVSVLLLCLENSLLNDVKDTFQAFSNQYNFHWFYSILQV